MGEAGEVVVVNRVDVATVVDASVTCGGATAPMPRDVGVCVNAGEDVVVEIRLDA